MICLRINLFILSMLTLAACQRAGGDVILTGAVELLPNPAAAGSGGPNLFRAEDGRIFLSWIEPASLGGHALRYAVLERGAMGWSEPRTIAAGANWFVNWADFPSMVALPDGLLAAHWLAKSGPGTYAYDVLISISRDDGRTWSAPITPHRDGTQTEHGFVSMLPWLDGSFAVVWLDGRQTTGHGESHDDAGAMMLMYALIDAEGVVSPEMVLDDRVCECCQTSAAKTSKGMVAVYRGRSPEEVRDIRIVRFVDGRWTSPEAVAHDGWKFFGCPVNGPSVSALGDRVAVAWFTGAETDDPRVLLAFSQDAGLSFGAPLRVDDGRSLGRVHVTMTDTGSTVVAWMAVTDDGAQIRLRLFDADGQAVESIGVARTTLARSSGFPRIAVDGDRVILAWTDSGERTEVRTAAIPFDAKSSVAHTQEKDSVESTDFDDSTLAIVQRTGHPK